MDIDIGETLQRWLSIFIAAFIRTKIQSLPPACFAPEFLLVKALFGGLKHMYNIC